jgi:hypothetical protein
MTAPARRDAARPDKAAGGRMAAVAVGPSSGDVGAITNELLYRTIPELASGFWRRVSWRITRVVDQPPNRILFVSLSYIVHGASRLRRTEIVAKIYGTDSGPRALAALRQLWILGFRPPERHRVTQPFGYAADRNILFQAKAPGVLWADFLRDGGRPLSVASAQAADWLIQLQCTAAATERSGAPDQADVEQRAAEELLMSFPTCEASLRPVTEALLPLLRPHRIEAIPSHGSYHPMNVLVTRRFTTVIDFDKFGQREAAYDVGYAIGRLLAVSYFCLGDIAPGARAALAFWRRYERGGQARWPRVVVQVSRFLLQSLHYELCALRKTRPGLAELWTTLMKEWMASDSPTTLEQLARPR